MSGFVLVNNDINDLFIYLYTCSVLKKGLFSLSNLIFLHRYFPEWLEVTQDRDRSMVSIII